MSGTPVVPLAAVLDSPSKPHRRRASEWGRWFRNQALCLLAFLLGMAGAYPHAAPQVLHLLRALRGLPDAQAKADESDEGVAGSLVGAKFLTCQSVDGSPTLFLCEAARGGRPIHP